MSRMQKISERSIVIDPAIKWWLDKDGEILNLVNTMLI